VAKAKKDYHVSVVQKKSTDEAMEYVKSKADKLKKASSSQFRIVTDFYVSARNVLLLDSSQ